MRWHGPGVLALAAALWAAPELALAADAPTAPIVIEVSSRSDRLLDEAVLRIQGELAAMGLDAALVQSGAAPDVPVEPGGSKSSAAGGGRLTLVRDGPLVRISAVGPSSPNAFVQALDARGPDVTAEVVAVRAVEALRAVMTLPERRAEPGETKPPEATPPPPAPPPVTPAASSGPARSLAPARESAFSLWSGAQGSFDPALDAPGLGAELGLFWGRSSVFVGLTGSLTLLRASVSAAEGDVDVRRGNAFVRVGYALPLGGPFEASFAGGAGWSRYLVDGHAKAGFVGLSARRDSPALLADAALHAWLSEYFALYARADLTLASNAPALRTNYRELGVLDRPTFWASLGLTVRLTRPGAR